MALAESRRRPPSGAATFEAFARGGGLRPGYQKVVDAAVWVFVACGSIALIEPSPYDFAFFAVLPLWALGGFAVHRTFLLLYFLLLLQTIVGFLALIPYWDESFAALFQYQTAYLMLTALFFALFVGERTHERAELILTACAVGALIAASAGVLGYFDFRGLGATFTRYGRASGTFKDPNVLGSFAVLGAVYLTQNLLLARTRAIALTALALAVIFAGIFLTFSRGSWAAAAFSLLTMGAAAFVTAENARAQRRIASFALVAAILLVIVVLALLSIDETREIFLQRASLIQDYDEGATGRFGNQARSLPELLARFGGFGPLRFRLFFGLEPHNSYIGAFANSGWIGGLLFLLLVGVTIFIGLRLMFKFSPYRRLAQAYFPPLMAFFLQALQIDIDHWRHIFLILGAVWGLEAARQKWAARQRAW